MGKIGQHFSDFRKSTPKSVMWVLLVAALIIVVILLLLIVGGKKTKKIIPDTDVIPDAPELTFEPNGPFDWSNTMVGETRTAEVKVYSNSRVQINDIVVQVEDEDDKTVGLSTTTTCTNEQLFITEDTPCLITINFEPTHAVLRTNVGVLVKWTAFEFGPDPIETKNAVTAVIGAAEKPKPKAEPVKDIAPETVAKPKPELEIFDESEDDEPTEPEGADDVVEDIDDTDAPETTNEFDSDFQDDVEDIAPEIDFSAPKPAKKAVAPVAAPAPSSKKYHSPFGNGCSDFSFPGYNTAGIQSGWITPKGGAYYYHPFSDTNCEKATGIYNADTGYIMDITNPARKIGSDVEHIRLTVAERMPTLKGASTRKSVARAKQLSDDDLDLTPAAPGSVDTAEGAADYHIVKKTKRVEATYLGSGESDGVYSSRPFDRTFVLRQYKPIPATIVSDIQADPDLLKGGLPVRATVDRNVYSDNGRTVIIPTGTLMLGYVTGELPGPYKAVGKMQIEWYQFIRPDGVEFNFEDDRPFSADSQGRKGVPGHGSTDYLQQFVMPMLTAVVPAAVNLIAPISDKFVNQIDLDNNTVVQSGTVRSSELAKNEIITAWNNVATKLLVDMMGDTTPPFSVAAGTRITVFSPVDLYVTCGDEEGGIEKRKCAFHEYGSTKRANWRSDANNVKLTNNMEELIGQVRSLMQSSIQDKCCDCKDNASCVPLTDGAGNPTCSQYSFATIDFYCRSFGTYQAKNNAKQEVIFEAQKEKGISKGTTEYNTQVLGLEYDEDGNIKNPFKKEKKESAPAEAASSEVLTCGDGGNPDANGCCAGETYTDMGEAGFNCCPDAGGDCFPPITM